MKDITSFIKKIQTACYISPEDSEKFDYYLELLGENHVFLDDLNRAVNEGRLYDIKSIEKRMENSIKNFDKES